MPADLIRGYSSAQISDGRLGVSLRTFHRVRGNTPTVLFAARDVELAAGDFNFASIIVAFIGAVVLLLIIRAVRGSAPV